MSIKKLGPDLWQIRLTYRDGKAKKDLRRRFSGSFVDAKVLEAELKAIRARGELAHWVNEAQRADDGEVSAAQTVAEFGAIWIKDYAEGEMKPSSLQTAKGHLRLHVYPQIGDRAMVSVGPKMISDLLRATAAKTSPQTANKVRATLSSMFKWAVRWEVLDRNPITTEKVPPLRVRRKKKFDNFLSPEEARAFLRAIAEDDSHRQRFPIYLFLLETGVRFGELAALLRADLDLKNGRATIYRGVRQGVVSSTKGDDERVVGLSPTLVAALREHTKTMMASGAPNPHRLVFPNDVGGYLSPESMRWSLKAGLEGAGVTRRVTLHGLRHSFCTMLAMDGRSALEIAHRAGHAQSSTTERYVHLAEALQVQAPSIVAQLGVGLLDG